MYLQYSRFQIICSSWKKEEQVVERMELFWQNFDALHHLFTVIWSIKASFNPEKSAQYLLEQAISICWHSCQNNRETLNTSREHAYVDLPFWSTCLWRSNETTIEYHQREPLFHCDMCLQIFVKKSHLRIASDKCQNLPVIELAQQHFYRSHHSSRQTLPIDSCGCSTLLLGLLSEHR